MGFGKKLRHAARHVTHAPSHVVHQVSHGTKNIIHETGKAVSNVGHAIEHGVKDVEHGIEHGVKEVVKGGEGIVNAPKKIIHSVVKGKINATFEKKMLEAIDNVEKELGERKNQDKAILDQTIANNINHLVETYKNLTDTNALQEAELELIEMLRSIIAAIHDCRYGFKDSVEDILKLDFDDYRVVEFLNKRPLSLTLKNFATHQNSEALSVLLPYFDKNFAHLSAENKADYSFLKEHAANKLGYKAEKEEDANYFDNMVKVISADAKAGILKVSNNSITAEVKNASTTANLLAQLNPNDGVTMNVTPNNVVTPNPTPITQTPAVTVSSENHAVQEETNRNACRM